MALDGIDKKNAPGAPTSTSSRTKTLRTIVAASALTLASAASSADPTPSDLIEFDPNGLNQYGLNISGTVQGANGTDMTNAPSDVLYGVIDLDKHKSYFGNTTLRPLSEWEQSGYDLIIQAFDTVNQQVVDVGADFTNFQWWGNDHYDISEPYNYFTFTDNRGTTLSGGLAADYRSIDINGAGLVTFYKVEGAIPAVPEPDTIYLLVPGIAGVYFVHRRRKAANSKK